MAAAPATNIGKRFVLAPLNDGGGGGGEGSGGGNSHGDGGTDPFSDLTRVGADIPTAINNSYLSPLVELFGDVSVGEGVFIAGNTIVKADPGARVCIGNETNLQDNIVVRVRNDRPSPASACGQLVSSVASRTSIAYQAAIQNSVIGNFTFVGFLARLENVVLEDGAFVLHGARLSNVTIGKDRLVPIGAVITTQAQADALK